MREPPRTVHRPRSLRSSRGRQEVPRMDSSRSWGGWIGFAALLTLIIGTIDFMMGLIAIVRGEYYAIHGNALIVFDTTAWGWITLLIGIAVILVGLALANGSGFARWLVLIIVSFNLL